MQLEVAPKTYDCLTSVFEEMEQISLYTNKSFRSGSAARKILEYHISDQAAQDRESVEKAVKEGQDLEEACAAYVSEEAFEKWYASFCDALNAAVGEQG